MLAGINLNEKYIRLVALRNKYLANEYLIARNKAVKAEPTSRIQFPFIAIISRFPPEVTIFSFRNPSHSSISNISN
jgi:hypothetical protein